jgi:hypothetical protein
VRRAADGGAHQGVLVERLDGQLLERLDQDALVLLGGVRTGVDRPQQPASRSSLPSTKQISGWKPNNPL